jgi:hypothetical protein
MAPMVAGRRPGGTGDAQPGEATVGRAGQRGAERGADAVQQQQRGVPRQDLLVAQMVDQVCDDDRIEREGAAAEHGDADDRGLPERTECRRQRAAEGRDRREQRERPAAVDAVGKPAQRPLQQGAGEDRRGDEEGDRVVRQADPRARAGRRRRAAR